MKMTKMQMEMGFQMMMKLGNSKTLIPIKRVPILRIVVS